MQNNEYQNVYLIELLEGNIRNGFSPLPADKQTGYWVLGLGALGDDGINANEIKPVAPEQNVLQNILNIDDFLVSRSNTPEKVGRSIRFQGEIENCSYPDLMMRFRINKNKADICYIEQILKSFTVRNYFKTHAAGSSSSMVKINKGILEKTPIFLPSLKQQQTIAEILLTWDQAISTTEKLLKNSQQQKKALMQQLLTGKKRLLDESGNLFQSKFKSSALKELFSINKGQQLNRDTLSSQGNYAVINGGIEPSGYTDVYNVESNTITISEGGNSCGYISYQRLPFWCGGHCYALSKYKLNIEFIYHLLKFNERQIMRLRVGSGLPNIQKKNLECLIVSYPDCEFEQAKIAEVLSTADKEIETLINKLGCLKQEKKALMQQLLTGKKRVKVAA